MLRVLEFWSGRKGRLKTQPEQLDEHAESCGSGNLTGGKREERMSKRSWLSRWRRWQGSTEAMNIRFYTVIPILIVCYIIKKFCWVLGILSMPVWYYLGCHLGQVVLFGVFFTGFCYLFAWMFDEAFTNYARSSGLFLWCSMREARWKQKERDEKHLAELEEIFSKLRQGNKDQDT